MAIRVHMIGGYIRRNGLTGWAILMPEVALREHRLMEEYKRETKVCEACGESNMRRLETHHAVPLWADSRRAATNPAGRFIVLCDHASHNCHLRHGHAGNFARKYVENCREVCAMIRREEKEQVIHERVEGAPTENP